MYTLTPYAGSYVNGRRARGEITRSTADDYRWTLSGLCESYGDRPLRMFGPAAVDRWLETVGHLADATRREYLSRVRSFTRWLVATGKLRADPTAHVPAVRQARHAPRTLTSEQVGRLLGVLTPNVRGTAVVWLMVGCGLRCCEVSRLRVEDYDPHGRTILVTGKGQHERTLPVPLEVAEAVDAYLELVGVVAGPLIRSELVPTRGLSPKTLSGYIRGWMLSSMVKVRPGDGRSAHALRRTAASDVADRGADVRVVQEMLGHQRAETTIRHYYRRVTMGQMSEAMAGRTYSA